MGMCLLHPSMYHSRPVLPSSQWSSWLRFIFPLSFTACYVQRRNQPQAPGWTRFLIYANGHRDQGIYSRDALLAAPQDSHPTKQILGKSRGSEKSKNIRSSNGQPAQWTAKHAWSGHASAGAMKYLFPWFES
jgi:hypothetical protein